MLLDSISIVQGVRELEKIGEDESFAVATCLLVLDTLMCLYISMPVPQISILFLRDDNSFISIIAMIHHRFFTNCKHYPSFV